MSCSRCLQAPGPESTAHEKTENGERDDQLDGVRHATHQPFGRRRLGHPDGEGEGAAGGLQDDAGRTQEGQRQRRDEEKDAYEGLRAADDGEQVHDVGVATLSVATPARSAALSSLSRCPSPRTISAAPSPSSPIRTAQRAGAPGVRRLTGPPASGRPAR